MSTTPTTLPLPVDTYVVSAENDVSGWPEFVAGPLLAMRLGRCHRDGVEVLTDTGTWRTMAQGQRIVTEPDQAARNSWARPGARPVLGSVPPLREDGAA